MKIQEIIESGLLESYVLGTATEQEVLQVNALCLQHPELLKEIEAIEQGLIHFSSGIAKPLSPDLKKKITAQLHFNTNTPEPGKVLPLKNNRIHVYRFGLAASLLLFVTSLVYNVLLQRKVSALNNELVALNSSASRMAQELEVQTTSFTKMQTELAIVSNPKMKKVMLQGMNSMASQSAAIHWNTETKELYFTGNSMAPPPGKQYQLWAIVDGKPVDAGMIDLSETAIFQKMKTIPHAQAFAVTIENVGGAPAPSLETMCLLGNV